MWAVGSSVYAHKRGHILSVLFKSWGNSNRHTGGWIKYNHRYMTQFRVIYPWCNSWYQLKPAVYVTGPLTSINKVFLHCTVKMLAQLSGSKQLTSFPNCCPASASDSCMERKLQNSPSLYFQEGADRRMDTVVSW